jgi:hypothetical protein
MIFNRNANTSTLQNEGIFCLSENILDVFPSFDNVCENKLRKTENTDRVCGDEKTKCASAYNTGARARILEREACLRASDVSFAQADQPRFGTRGRCSCRPVPVPISSMTSAASSTSGAPGLSTAASISIIG